MKPFLEDNPILNLSFIISLLCILVPAISIHLQVSAGMQIFPIVVLLISMSMQFIGLFKCWKIGIKFFEVT